MTIIQFLRNFGWIGSVRIAQHEPRQSHVKASIIVVLALDILGLRFQAQDAVRFAMAGRQHLFYENRLATGPNGEIFSGFSAQMPSLGSKPGALTAAVAQEAPFLEASGKVLSAYLQARQSGLAPNLVERWVNALYWFGEGRRQASDFVAVVDYGCAADVLSGAGGNANKMAIFAGKALGHDPSTAPDAKTLSLKDVVTKIYGEGRTKLAHGEMPGLFEPLASVRQLADGFVQLLFDRVTPALAEVIERKPDILVQTKGQDYSAFEALLETRSRKR